MTGLGFRIISIDYRLGLKGAEKVGVGQARELHHAILLAVEDLFSATAFMIDNAEQLGIDTGNIVISGSSAGAITAMQAEYELCNGTPVSEVLPEDFRYEVDGHRIDQVDVGAQIRRRKAQERSQEVEA